MKPKILVIDDEPDILEAIQIILESQGYQPLTASTIDSPDQVVELAPKLILMDMLLVGTSGADICKKLKSDARTKNIPIVLLSANPESKLKNLSQECGANSYIPKPFDITHLLTTIKHLLPSC